MNKHLLHKSGRGALVAAITVASSLALAQSAGTAADTTTADGASARIQRGPAPETGTAAPAEQMAPATQDAAENAAPQGFVGDAQSPTDAAQSDGAALESGTIPAAPPPAPEAQTEPLTTTPQGFVGDAQSEPASAGTQGFVGSTGAEAGAGVSATPDTRESIWETQPGNVVTPPGIGGEATDTQTLIP